MGRLIIDSRSKYLIETSKELSKATIRLIEDVNRVSNISEENIFIAVEIHAINEGDISTMVVSKVIGEKIEILYCKNELDYR